jgi:uncharacterized protein Yka (UPF0111/DUF47 family)
MLERMGEFDDKDGLGAQIFDVELNADKTKIKFTEACDHWFSVELSKAELSELIADLEKILDQMEEEHQ